MKFEINTDHDMLLKDLEKLCKVAGPLQSVAKISPNDPRLGKHKDFPIVKETKRIVADNNEKENTDVQVIEHHGNLIIIGNILKSMVSLVMLL